MKVFNDLRTRGVLDILGAADARAADALRR
jgi:hypothetical protein